MRYALSAACLFLSGLAACAAPGGLPAPLREGLVLYYSFDAVEGTTVPDDAGGGHPGLMRKAQWVAEGKRGGAMRFRGKADVIAPHTNDLAFTAQDSFTIALWARHEGAFGAWQGVVCKSRGAPPFVGLYVEPGGRWVVYTGPLRGPKATKAWQHVAIVQDGKRKTRSLYMDGKVVDTGRAEAVDGTEIFSVGSGGCGYAYFPGTIDEVCVYRRALDADELSRQMAATSAPAPGGAGDARAEARP